MNPNEATYAQEPVHSKKLEAAALGCVLQNPNLFHVLKAATRPEAFYLQSHRIILNAMRRVAEDGGQPDTISVCDRLNAAGELEAIGGANAVVQLTTDAVMPASLDYTLQQLANRYQLRQLATTAGELTHRAFNPETDAAQTIEDATAKLSGILSGDGARLFESTVEGLAELDKAKDNPESVLGVPTGFGWYDKLTKGFVDGASVFLGGLFKAGKSKLALALAIQMMRSGYHVDWHSCEMSNGEMTQRALSFLSGLEEYQIPGNQLRSPAEEAKLEEARKLWASWEGRWRHRMDGMLDVNQIQAQTMARRMQLGADARYLVVVDYVQSATAKLKGISNSDHRNIEACCYSLNDTAKKSRSPFLILYQVLPSKLERRKETEYWPIPRATDAKGTSAIMQTANQLLTIHRPWWELSERDELHQFGILSMQANRAGGAQHAMLRCQLGTNRFYSWDAPVPAAFQSLR